jgi:hypothetical protein
VDSSFLDSWSGGGIPAKSKTRLLDTCLLLSIFKQKTNVCNNHIYHFHAS